MDVILAVIADSEQATIVIDKEAVEINYFSCILLILLKPFDGGLVQPLAKRLPGMHIFVHQTTPLEGEMAPSWWRCLHACV